MSLEEEESKRFKDWDIQMVLLIKRSKNTLYRQIEGV